MRQLAGAVEVLVAEPDPQGRWLEGLRERLAALRDELVGHFGRESHSYLFRELPVVYPHHARRIERLEAEHAEILRRLDEGLRLADELRRSDESEVERLRTRMMALMTTLRRHEAEEDEILVNAYWNDLGGGD